MPPSLKTVLPNSIGNDINSTSSLPALGVAVGAVSYSKPVGNHTLDIAISVPWLTKEFHFSCLSFGALVLSYTAYFSIPWPNTQVPSFTQHQTYLFNGSRI